MTLVGLNSGLTIANETVIMKEGSRRLRNDSESHTTSLLDNSEHNYRQSSVIVCSLLVYQTHNKRKHYKSTWCSQKENENPDVPKITKALLVIKWTEAFTDYLSHANGVRMIPLVYVIRPEQMYQWLLRRLQPVSHTLWNMDRSNKNW